MDTFFLILAAFFALATVSIVVKAEEPNFPMHLEGFPND